MKLSRSSILLEQIAFLICVAGLCAWMFSNDQVQTRWAKHILGFYRPGTPGGATPPYSGLDAAAEFAAAWSARGLPPVLPQEATDALTRSRIRYRSGQLQSLYRPALPGAIRTDAPGWIEVKPQAQPDTVHFNYGTGHDFSNLPAFALIGDPWSAFVGTSAVIFWSRPADPNHFTSGGPSMAAMFERRGDRAIAVFPVARLVDWWKEPVIARIRIDVRPNGNGRLFFAGGGPARSSRSPQ